MCSQLLILILLCGVFFVAVTENGTAIDLGIVYIRADGSIDPPTMAIVNQENNVYTLSQDLTCSINIQRDNVVLNGLNHKIFGVELQQ